ncbi:MAG TPA: lytic transglycosylase domain-containing protein [Longimicrobiales bacterium]|nr:lytic transglycosylase domain-containing protein [Longimicrobiales bacterium]
MTQQDTGQRRRADDFKAHPENTETLDPAVERRRNYRRPRRAPGRSFLRRFRQPIIGLSIAGAAAPLINAGTADTSATSGSQPQPTEADLARASVATASGGGDAEEKLAARIASESSASTETAAVQEAVSKYNISEDLARDIYEIAQAEGIEPKVAYGLVKTESSFKTSAISHVGARGLTQVMPRTARWMVPGTKASDLHDQKTNLRLGFRYLNQMIDKYQGDVRLALLAYNRGPGTVDKILRRGGDPNNGYADKVLRG